MKQPKPTSALFISKEGLATFWFLLGAACIVGTALYVRAITKKTALRPQFLILTQPDVTVMRPSVSPEQESETAMAQTRLAMDSIFNKSSLGLDSGERARKFLSSKAWTWVQSELIAKQKDAFKESRMHQKVEIEAIDLHPQADDGAVLASVRGQLIRTGVLDGRLFNEVWSLRADLMWTRHPSLRLGGRFPLLCSAFSCRETPVASTLRHAVPAVEPAPQTP